MKPKQTKQNQMIRGNAALYVEMHCLRFHLNSIGTYLNAERFLTTDGTNPEEILRTEWVERLNPSARLIF